jgi:hypothetical protein
MSLKVCGTLVLVALLAVMLVAVGCSAKTSEGQVTSTDVASTTPSTVVSVTTTQPVQTTSTPTSQVVTTAPVPTSTTQEPATTTVKPTTTTAGKPTTTMTVPSVTAEDAIRYFFGKGQWSGDHILDNWKVVIGYTVGDVADVDVKIDTPEHLLLEFDPNGSGQRFTLEAWVDQATDFGQVRALTVENWPSQFQPYVSQVEYELGYYTYVAPITAPVSE